MHHPKDQRKDIVPSMFANMTMDFIVFLQRGPENSGAQRPSLYPPVTAVQRRSFHEEDWREPEDHIMRRPLENENWFRNVPRRDWRIAAVNNWRDLPWHELTNSERQERELMWHRNRDEIRREVREARASEPPYRRTTPAARPAVTRTTASMAALVELRAAASRLFQDPIWDTLYEAYGGVPHYAAVDMAHNIRSRRQFRHENLLRLLRATRRPGSIVDVSRYLLPIQNRYPPQLADLDPGPVIPESTTSFRVLVVRRPTPRTGTQHRHRIEYAVLGVVHPLLSTSPELRDWRDINYAFAGVSDSQLPENVPHPYYDTDGNYHSDISTDSDWD